MQEEQRKEQEREQLMQEEEKRQAELDNSPDGLYESYLGKLAKIAKG
jgi:hypothetical protein